MATLGALAELVQGKVVGDENLEITGVAGLEDAKAGMISLVATAKVADLAKESNASAFILPSHLKDLGLTGVLVDNPRLAFAEILQYFFPKPEIIEGIHGTAVIEEGFACGVSCSIGPLVYIGKDVRLGDRVKLHAGVVVEDGTSIGSDTEIFGNVVIRSQSEIGDRVIIHPGTVIGADGFGFVTVMGKHHKVPQVGKVKIEDDVEIGANVTIDRATTGMTLIKRGTKIDNLVQIGHNVQVGEDNIIVSMSGIAGSTRVGDRVTLAGQSGIVGHISIGSDSVVAARGMVIGNLPPNSFVSGQPARPHAEDMRIQAAAGKLPELLKSIRGLEKRLSELEELIGKNERENEN